MYIEPIVENIERITFKTYEIAAASTDNELRPGTNNGLRPSTDNGFNVVPITAQDEGYILAGRGYYPAGIYLPPVRVIQIQRSLQRSLQRVYIRICARNTNKERSRT